MAGVLELLRCLAGRRRLARVRGESMAPMLRDAQRVLFDPSAYARSGPRDGDIVVAARPGDGRMLVKRVASRPRDAEGVWLEGLNAACSTDSRSFGAVPANAVIGRVTSRL